MEYIEIDGGYSLQGHVSISGSKNGALALLATAFLTNEEMTYTQIPDIDDIKEMMHIFEALNASVSFHEHTVKIKTKPIEYPHLTMEAAKKFRASYYFIGALLPKSKQLAITPPGGCNFEQRPIDIHLDGFSQLGVHYQLTDVYHFHYEDSLTTKIHLKNVSFGATVNMLLFCAQRKTDTILHPVAPEIEIQTLVDCINKMGGSIQYLDEQTIHIKGNQIYHGIEFNNIPDRLEIGTYAFLSAIKGPYTLSPVYESHITAILDVLSQSGASYLLRNDCLTVFPVRKANSIVLETGLYPHFPTDLQPILTAYLLYVPRIHILKETIYKQRFSHVDELKKMGASLFIEDNTLLINGIFALQGTELTGKDLRSSAALLFAALGAKGKTKLTGYGYLRRGYEQIIEKLKALGAHIEVHNEA